MMMFSGDQFVNAERSIEMYTSIFNNGSIEGILKYPPGLKDEGKVVHAQYKLNGYVSMRMDSSFDYGSGFNESISIVVECENQAEIDHFWDKLIDGSTESMCGWLKDRFGVSLQIVPQMLGQLMSNPEPLRRVMLAFVKMKKFDIPELMHA